MKAEGSAVSPILRVVKSEFRVDLAQAFSTAARQPGQSAGRLAKLIWRSRFSNQMLTPRDFFLCGLHRPGLSDAFCASFIGSRAANRFNAMLNGPDSENESRRTGNKLHTAAVLEAAGLPVAAMRAVFPGGGRFDRGRVLKSAADIAAFLLAEGNTPCFGKPVRGAGCKGAISVEGAVGDGRIALGDGRIVAAADLAAEIVANFSDGYLFQDLLRAGPEISGLSGPVLPNFRVFTLRLKGAMVPVYADLRLPAAGAMVDGDGWGRNVRLKLDIETGEVLRAQDMTQFSGSDLAASPVTGQPFKGYRVPGWASLLKLAADVHAQFPLQTAAGSDIGFSDQGFVVNEINSKPAHLNFQIVSMEGLLNPRFNPLFRAALAERGITRPQAGVPWPAG